MNDHRVANNGETKELPARNDVAFQSADSMSASTSLHRLYSSPLARIMFPLIAVVVLSLSSSYLTRDIRLASGGRADDHAFLMHLFAWALWLVLLWFCLRLRRLVLSQRGPRGWGRVVCEIALCAAYAFFSVETLHASMSRAFGPPRLPGDLSVDNVKPMMMVRSAAMYTFVVVALAAVSAEVRRRRSEAASKALQLQRETLERKLADARLETLQSQLNPHFLFNALHVIGGLILSEDKLGAHRALASLSTLLRRSLKQGENFQARLEEELELVSRYIELERLRFGDRLKYSVIASPETLQAYVPTLILLPIVENAVTHGLEPFPQGGTITLQASRTDEVLELRVADDGIGWSSSHTKGGMNTGIGLSNTSGRLDALFGVDAAVAVEDRTPRGTLVSIRLPFQRMKLPNRTGHER